MKILHTSDWHLGRNLFGRKRYKEFSAFLDWLYQTIMHECIDTLLICGDIFNTNTPSNKAQELYYNFLCKVSKSTCKDIVIIAGNHDSPTFLEAPKSLLQALNIHVVGVGDSFSKEIIELYDRETGLVKSIICAVPYLRDKDVRESEVGESYEDKNRHLLTGIKNHYAEIAQKAQELQNEIIHIQRNFVPIIALGHLFVAGGQTIKGDGVRDLYVGSLALVGADCFSPVFDYVALGHIHIAQKVNNNEYIRYCGSPIPMGFGEAKHVKKVIILNITAENINSVNKSISEIEIPCFQKLIQIVGDFKEIEKQICELISLKFDEYTSLSLKTNYLDNFNNVDCISNNEVLEDDLQNVEFTSQNNIQPSLEQEKRCAISYTSTLWLEIEYTGKIEMKNLREELESLICDTPIEILCIRNSENYKKTLRASKNINNLETLNDLTVYEVFEKCMQSFNIPEEEQEDLRLTYKEIMQKLKDDDINAE